MITPCQRLVNESVQSYAVESLAPPVQRLYLDSFVPPSGPCDSRSEPRTSAVGRASIDGEGIAVSDDVDITTPTTTASTSSSDYNNISADGDDVDGGGGDGHDSGGDKRPVVSASTPTTTTSPGASSGDSTLWQLTHV